MSQRPLNISFLQALTGTRAGRWVNLSGRLISVQLAQESDTFKWGLTKSGSYTMQSIYYDDHTKFLGKYIWKIKFLLKIRIFISFLHPKVLLTKDNLEKRKWQGCNKYIFL
jgi:hypothetical protein